MKNASLSVNTTVVNNVNLDEVVIGQADESNNTDVNNISEINNESNDIEKDISNI
jgi:hypothetical protein